jgi:hypothetical protein
MTPIDIFLKLVAKRILSLPLGRVMFFFALIITSVNSQAIDLIVNYSVSVQSLQLNVARSLFGMRQLTWPDGKPVRVFVLSQQNALHAAFCKEVLNVYPYQLQQSWNRLVYSGTGQAPTEVATEQDMIEQVAANPGAIGYINTVSNNEHVRKISIR